MFRKTLFALAAAASLGVAALVPTTASAHWHGGFGNHHHFGYWGPRVTFYGGAALYDPCLRKRWVPTPFGLRLRWVNVCVY